MGCRASWRRSWWQVNDIIEHRIEKNLRIVSKTTLVCLPDNASFSLEDFVIMQEEHIRTELEVTYPLAARPWPCSMLNPRCGSAWVMARVSQGLKAKNVEIETAVEDLISLATSLPLDSSIRHATEGDCDAFRLRYNTFMYRVRACARAA